MALTYARPLARLVSELEKLPGVGPKSAQRLAMYVLRISDDEASSLADAILTVKRTIHACRVCGNYTDMDVCDICTNPRRDPTVLCVVADPKDLIAMEKTNEFRGLYHVLQGVISPMDGIGPEKLRIKELEARLRDGDVHELIIATNPTVEGDATAAYIAQHVARGAAPDVKVTRLAHGMPIGGDLDYTDQATLISALEWRREIK
jgi:recombination protein RecR